MAGRRLGGRAIFWLSLRVETGPVLGGPVISFMNGPARGTTATAPMVTTPGTADMAADTGTTVAGTTQDSAATIAVTDTTLTGTAGSAAERRYGIVQRTNPHA